MQSKKTAKSRLFLTIMENFTCDYLTSIYLSIFLLAVNVQNFKHQHKVCMHHVCQKATHPTPIS